MTVESASGEAITSIGALTNVDGVNLGRALAMSPIGGIMYTTFPSNLVGNPWRLGTVDLASGEITTVASISSEP